MFWDPERLRNEGKELNKELIESCDLLHAFLSQEDGYTGGTRFEIEFALKLGIPVQVHWENRISQLLYQYSFSFIETRQGFFLAWEEFFHTTTLEIGGDGYEKQRQGEILGCYQRERHAEGGTY